MYTYNSEVAKQCNIPDEVLAEFCDDRGYDGVDVYKNTVVAYNEDVVENYYGQSLLCPIIKKQWAIEGFYNVVSDWYNYFAMDMEYPEPTVVQEEDELPF